MKKNDNDFIKLIREEWNSKLSALAEKVDLAFNTKVDGKNKSVLDPGLKIKSKVRDDKDKDEINTYKDQGGVLYTVTAVSIRGVDLRPPDGNPDGSNDFFVSKDELEKNYVRD
jgi:hypothetical protein